MAAEPLKPIKMYLVAGKLREQNRIYEAELHQLLQQQAVRQLVITCHQDESFSLAVLADHRADYAYRPYERVGSKVLKLRPVSIEQEGFAPLFSVRNKAIRKYRNLDTLVRGLKRCGQLPPTYLRQGK